MDSNATVAFVVFGASGHLAKTKTFPALFELFRQQRLPLNFSVYGYARSNFTQEQFQSSLNLGGEEASADFFSHLQYVRGTSYDDVESFQRLCTMIGPEAHRVCYCAVPPSLFLRICSAFKAHVESAAAQGAYTRYVIEKPFGRDLASATELHSSLLRLFGDLSQVYLIDHYLGKHMVNNILQLRFSNPWFGPQVWSTIENVSIVVNESVGTRGRGGYFDSYGTIRDMLQNHLLQIMTLLAMDKPAKLTADLIRASKLQVLKGIAPLEPSKLVVGQYSTYTDDKTVPDGSLCPTFATALLKTAQGVPFLLSSGKALERRMATITIEFAAGAQLVLQIQPEPHVRLSMAGAPPLTSEPPQADEDAYVLLIERVLRGDQSMFVSTDELLEAWRIFTPVLHHLENNNVRPIVYEPGSAGPSGLKDIYIG